MCINHLKDRVFFGISTLLFPADFSYFQETKKGAAMQPGYYTAYWINYNHKSVVAFQF